MSNVTVSRDFFVRVLGIGIVAHCVKFTPFTFSYLPAYYTTEAHNRQLGLSTTRMLAKAPKSNPITI